MKHFLTYITVALATLSFFAFRNHSFQYPISEIVNPAGNTIETRFNTPQPYQRNESKADTFEWFLRNLPLKEHGSKVLLYDGREKNDKVHEAVIKLDVGKADLQQCADACMRLRSEFLFKEKRYAEIHFNFTNGWRADYSKWMEGYRINVNGNQCSWQKQASPDNSYATFRKYLDKVFSYAGTLSLSKELTSVKLSEIKPGDVFIQGGSPGHAVMVVDVAINPKSGKKIFMIAQSYMPAQEIHVLKNPKKESISPWYELTDNEDLLTPEWIFKKGSLKRF
jgi:hypothetical protein